MLQVLASAGTTTAASPSPGAENTTTVASTPLRANHLSPPQRGAADEERPQRPPPGRSLNNSASSPRFARPSRTLNQLAPKRVQGASDEADGSSHAAMQESSRILAGSRIRTSLAAANHVDFQTVSTCQPHKATCLATVGRSPAAQAGKWSFVARPAAWTEAALEPWTDWGAFWRPSSLS